METPLQDEANIRLIDKRDFGTEKNIVYDILNDLTNRNGLDNEWNMIDDEIKESIIEKWISIADKNIYKTS